MNPSCETQSTGEAVVEPQEKSKSWSRVKNFDEVGIPLEDIEDVYVYHPVAAAQYALMERNRYEDTGEEVHLDNALLVANWLVQTQDCETGKWAYNFDRPVKGTGATLAAPWSSAMAQGEGISVLVRAYADTSDERYLNAARFALEPLKTDVSEGGLRRDFFGHTFYEEYPTDPPSFVLNGFMFTLLGLHDLAEVDPDSEAQALYSAGRDTLIYALPFYDQGNTTAYHLGHLTHPPRNVYTIPRYHTLHIKQLDRLNEIEPNPTIAYYRDLWQGYVENEPEKWEGTDATFVYEDS